MRHIRTLLMAFALLAVLTSCASRSSGEPPQSGVPPTQPAETASAAADKADPSTEPSQPIQDEPTANTAENGTQQISISDGTRTIVFELNESTAAQALFDQLPLTIEVSNYSTNEKIFYPPQELDAADTPLVDSAQAGTLAYYAPWADVVMFYGSFGSASGLYELGQAVSGVEEIEHLGGMLTIEAVN